MLHRHTTVSRPTDFRIVALLLAGRFGGGNSKEKRPVPVPEPEEGVDDDREAKGSIDASAIANAPLDFELTSLCHGACKNPQVWATKIPHPLHSDRR
jgi:hypothetical protein